MAICLLSVWTLLDALLTGAEGWASPGNQRCGWTQPGSYSPSQSAAFLWWHGWQQNPKQPLFSEGNTCTSRSNLFPSSHLFFLTLTFFSPRFLFIQTGQKEQVCLPYDCHTLFTPPSPKPNTSPPQRSKVCPSACLCVIFSLLWLYSISNLLSLCLMLVSNVSVSLVVRLIWAVGPEQSLYVIQTHDYYLFNI